MTLLPPSEIEALVQTYGPKVNEGRPIESIIEAGELPILRGCKIHRGKVSTSIYGDALKTPEGLPIRLMYRSNRVSTHDHHRGQIAFKDQVLALLHDRMLTLVEDAVGNSQISIPGLAPTSTVIAAENLEPILFENVLRRYMAESSTSTSLYQHWLAGDRVFCGHILPKHLSANCKLPYIMDTPSTKAKNDESVSPQYLIESGVCTEAEYTEIRNNSILACGMVAAHDRAKGMILVDVKLEHGRTRSGEIVIMDEVFTLDSARRWKLDPVTGGPELDENDKPKSYSKEFIRAMQFDPNTGLITPEQEVAAAVRYIEAYQHISDRPFEPDLRPREQRLIESTQLILDTLSIR